MYTSSNRLLRYWNSFNDSSWGSNWILSTRESIILRCLKMINKMLLIFYHLISTTNFRSLYKNNKIYVWGLMLFDDFWGSELLRLFDSSLWETWLARFSIPDLNCCSFILVGDILRTGRGIADCVCRGKLVLMIGGFIIELVLVSLTSTGYFKRFISIFTFYKKLLPSSRSLTFFWKLWTRIFFISSLRIP